MTSPIQTVAEHRLILSPAPLTFRQQAALAAMSALLLVDPDGSYLRAAQRAWDMADALLAAEEKKP